MNLFIKEVFINNFKLFKEIRFICNSSFNIIIGENNIGKSTIFEAIQLWYRCYELLINKKGTGFYKAKGSINYYLAYSELFFLRLKNDFELFYDRKNPSIKLSLLISDGFEDYRLGVEVQKPKSLENSFYRVRYVDQLEFEKFNEKLMQESIKPRDVISIYQTRPVSGILVNEPYMNVGQVKKKIAIGKSHEVLRNKIISKERISIDKLSKILSSLIGAEFKFIEPTAKQKRNDEYIDLKVCVDYQDQSLYLQGSGFLQMAEILSTIEYIDAPLNILLVDEPDSHIHAMLQNKLVRYLKSITSSQLFVISHNDRFVGEVREDELFYLNSDVKADGVLKHISHDGIDILKKDLGGVILGLERLNYSKKIVLVEGPSDEKYITNICKQVALKKGEEYLPEESLFLTLRGKDSLEKKLEHYNRLLQQLYRNKKLLLIYDKDFCTIEENVKFQIRLRKIISRHDKVQSHPGYCMESIAFHDLPLLVEFLARIAAQPTDELIKAFVDSYFKTLCNDLERVTTEYYGIMEKKFLGQKKNTRNELSNMVFGDFIRESVHENVSYMMNKFFIKDFIVKFEEATKCILVNPEEDSEGNYSFIFFNRYIEEMSDMSGFNKYFFELYDLMVQ